MLPLASVPGPPGPPGYAYGSRNTSVPPTKMFISKSAVAANVATLTVQVVEGNIPLVGQTLYVYNTSNNAGALNTSDGTITLSAVSITAATGAGTISYAKTTGNLSITNDQGYAYAIVGEVAETLVQGKSQQFAVSGYGISWSYFCPSQPASLSIQLEGSISDVDAEYEIIGAAQTTVSGSNAQFATLPENVNFARLNVTSASGGSSPTIIAKMQLTRS